MAKTANTSKSDGKTKHTVKTNHENQKKTNLYAKRSASEAAYGISNREGATAVV